MARAIGALMQGVRGAMLAAFLAMIVLTLFQVANRFALGWPVFWTEELIVLLLVWSVMLGLPVQLWRHEEILVDILPLAGRAQDAKLWLAAGLSVLFCAILAWSGWLYAERGLPVRSPALGISRVWFFAPIPLGAGLAMLALLARPAAPPQPGRAEDLDA